MRIPRGLPCRSPRCWWRAWRSSRRTLALVSAALLSVLNAAGALAQPPRYAPLVLQLPAGTRAAGLGGASVALRDAEAIFANPAAAGLGTGVSASYGRFARAAGLGSIASSGTAGPIGIGIGAQLLDFRVIGGRVPQSSEVLTLRNGADMGASVTGSLAAATVFRGLRIGAALKYAQEQLAGHQGGSAAFDVGILKDRGRTTWGASVQNIGPDVDVGASRARLPLRATIGGAVTGLPMGGLDLSMAAAISALRDGFVSPAGGVELAYTWLEGLSAAVRLGARRPELRELRPLTGGLSVTIDRMTIDYAFEDLRRGTAHRLALRLR